MEWKVARHPILFAWASPFLCCNRKVERNPLKTKQATNLKASTCHRTGEPYLMQNCVRLW